MGANFVNQIPGIEKGSQDQDIDFNDAMDPCCVEIESEDQDFYDAMEALCRSKWSSKLKAALVKKYSNRPAENRFDAEGIWFMLGFWEV